MFGTCCRAAQASPSDLVTVASAVSWFITTLLPAATTLHQVMVLQQLLGEVWGDGAALAAAAAEDNQQQQPEGAEGGSLAGISPLHEAWCALLQHMLQLPSGSAMVMSCFDRLLLPAAQGPRQQPQQQQQLLVPVTESEMGDLLATAAATCPPATAMALGLLSPYSVHQEAAVEQLLTSRVQSVGFSESEGGVELLGCLLVRGKWRELLGGGKEPAAPGVAARTAGGGGGGGVRVQGALDAGVLQGFYRLLLMTAAHPLAAAAGLGGARSSSSFTGQQGRHQQQELSSLLLPLAVSGLVSSGCYSSAAALVARRLRLHPELQTLDSSLLLLDRFLVAVAEGARGNARSSNVATRGKVAVGPSEGEAAGCLRCCVVLLEQEMGRAAEEAHQQLMGSLRGPAAAAAVARGTPAALPS